MVVRGGFQRGSLNLGPRTDRVPPGRRESELVSWGPRLRRPVMPDSSPGGHPGRRRAQSSRPGAGGNLGQELEVTWARCSPSSKARMARAAPGVPHSQSTRKTGLFKKSRETGWR